MAKLKKVTVDSSMNKKQIMSFLVENLSEDQLDDISFYYDCFRLNIVEEIEKMDSFNDEDIVYFADKLYNEDEDRLLPQKAFDIVYDMFVMLGKKEICDESGLRNRILSMKISELEVDREAEEFFKKLNINKVEDLLNMRIRDLFESREKFYFDLSRVTSSIMDMVADIEKTKRVTYTEDNHPGKNRCEMLKRLRKNIAEANDIEFEPNVCHHRGPCLGTCPMCDSEIEYLNMKLKEKRDRGEIMMIAGLGDKELVLSGCDVWPLHEPEMGGCKEYDYYGPKYIKGDKKWYD